MQTLLCFAWLHRNPLFGYIMSVMYKYVWIYIYIYVIIIWLIWLLMYVFVGSFIPFYKWVSLGVKRPSNSSPWSSNEQCSNALQYPDPWSAKSLQRSICQCGHASCDCSASWFLWVRSWSECFDHGLFGLMPHEISVRTSASLVA